MSDSIKVEGYTELLRALNKYNREVKKQLRTELRTLATPVQIRAQGLAQEKISRIGPQWFRMRIGVTTSAVYVAPKQKGARTRKRKRPNLGYLLQHEALEPALDENTLKVRAGLEAMLDRIGSESGF